MLLMNPHMKEWQLYVIIPYTLGGQFVTVLADPAQNLDKSQINNMIG